MSLARLKRFALLATLVAWTASAGEPSGWSEVQTPHVCLKSDLSPEDARRAALKVERTRAALLAAAWPGAQPEGERLEVVAFAHAWDFEEYFGRFVGGYFSREYPPTAFLYGAPETWEHRVTPAREETTSILKHELTHHLAFSIYRREPRWFAEGLAQYLETMRVSEDGRTATLGDINLVALRFYKKHLDLGVADVLAWGGALGAKDDATNFYLYGLSWLLVHWLNNTHPQDFARFQVLLGRGIEPDKAWTAVFGRLDTRDIDEKLHRYSRDGDYHVSVVPIPAAPEAVSVRPLASAEVHVARATAALAGAGNRTDASPQLVLAESEVALALEDDASNVRGLRMKAGFVPPEARLALGRRAALAHPEDGLAWLTLGEALPSTPESWDERAAAFRKATTLLPGSPTAFKKLALLYLERGNSKDALEVAISAAGMAPFDAAILETLAVALAGVGRCTEALAMAARARDAEPQKDVPRSESLESRASIRKWCTDAGAGAARASASLPSDAPPEATP
jgi:tetratricopeptide (TPR) repeat protein